MSRIVLNAQEDLRREIARAMHDGPAQSLTNIVLQAQIVERLLGRDPDGARGELRLLVQMVQQTLDATKSFIFDVRPMVLDDLGLVPTLRRATRERGRRAGIPVEFDSIGADRRIAVDLESSLFRIVDEALAAYLAGNPDRVAVRLDWSEAVIEVEVAAYRDPTDAMAAADRISPRRSATRRGPARTFRPPSRRCSSIGGSRHRARRRRRGMRPSCRCPPRPGARSSSGRRRRGSPPSSPRVAASLRLHAEIGGADGVAAGTDAVAAD